MEYLEHHDMNEELRWMLASIRHLLHAKDYYGAFVFCLIAIEPFRAHHDLFRRTPDERIGSLAELRQHC